MIVRVLKIFEATRNELVGLSRSSGVLVDMFNNEFKIIHWLVKGVKFCLQHVEVSDGEQSFIKIRHFWWLIHVLTDVAYDLRIIYSLIA